MVRQAYNSRLDFFHWYRKFIPVSVGRDQDWQTLQAVFFLNCSVLRQNLATDKKNEVTGGDPRKLLTIFCRTTKSVVSVTSVTYPDEGFRVDILNVF